MKVKDLIEKLEQMPPDAEVMHLCDGEPRSSIEVVYLSKTGLVITSDIGEYCYSNDARPIGAPTEEELVIWWMPKKNT